MARPKALSNTDLVQNRINELTELLKPETSAKWNAELNGLREALKHLTSIEALLSSIKPTVTRVRGPNKGTGKRGRPKAK